MRRSKQSKHALSISDQVGLKITVVYVAGGSIDAESQVVSEYGFQFMVLVDICVLFIEYASCPKSAHTAASDSRRRHTGGAALP